MLYAEQLRNNATIKTLQMLSEQQKFRSTVSSFLKNVCL
jgi:hypothetical protein